MPNPIQQTSTPAPRAATTPRQPGKASVLDYRVLKARQKELNSQLSDVQDRREELARDALQKTGADRAAIESHVGILDQRVTQLEAELTSVGRDVADAVPASSIETPPPFNSGYDDGNMVGAGFAGAGIMFALLVPFLIQAFRRRRPVPASSAQPLINGDRVERMEQAIDSIAVEIERVSENQRFMTRLLTETQLAGTIAAVRGSAEAAKAAVEESPHAR